MISLTLNVANNVINFNMQISFNSTRKKFEQGTTRKPVQKRALSTRKSNLQYIIDNNSMCTVA